MPLSCLNTFLTDWQIKVKCIKKSPIKTWNKPNSQGKLFSMELMDRFDTQIQASMFNEAADKFYDLI